MSFLKGCPGAINLREVRPQDIACPHCGVEVEIWSDEPFVRCPGCGCEVTQTRGASCIDWCSQARQCVGSDKYERLKRMLADMAVEAGESG